MGQIHLVVSMVMGPPIIVGIDERRREEVANFLLREMQKNSVAVIRGSNNEIKATIRMNCCNGFIFEKFDKPEGDDEIHDLHKRLLRAQVRQAEGQNSGDSWKGD